MSGNIGYTIKNKKQQMNNNLILLGGMLLGQTAVTVICVYIKQYGKPIDYWTAFKSFVIAETASYAVALVGLLIAMFILPDYIDPSHNLKDTGDSWEWKLKIAKNFRLASIVYGAFVPLIMLLIYKKGLRAIKNENEKLNSNG